MSLYCCGVLVSVYQMNTLNTHNLVKMPYFERFYLQVLYKCCTIQVKIFHIKILKNLGVSRVLAFSDIDKFVQISALNTHEIHKYLSPFDLIYCFYKHLIRVVGIAVSDVCTFVSEY